MNIPPRYKNYKALIEPISVPTIETGSCLDDYILNDPLGKGSFAEVFNVCKDYSCQYVAKIVDFTRPPGPDIMMAIFNREVYFNQLLNNSGLVPQFYGAWTCDNKGYVISELFDCNMEQYGSDLAKSLVSKFPQLVTTRTLVFYPDQINRMLTICQKLSDLNIIHGDLKPDNFLYKDSQIVVTDFGLAGDYKNYLPILGWHYKFECNIPPNVKRIINYYNLWNLELYLIASNTYIYNINNESLSKFDYTIPIDIVILLERLCKKINDIEQYM